MRRKKGGTRRKTKTKGKKRTRVKTRMRTRKGGSVYPEEPSEAERERLEVVRADREWIAEMERDEAQRDNIEHARVYNNFLTLPRLCLDWARMCRPV